jgi:galactonate dehydratase
MTAIAALEPVVVNVSPKTNWSFIAVTASDGAIGWGECSLNGWEPLVVAQAQMLARDAAGRDLDAADQLVRYLPHSPGGLVAHAVKSATEQALVDVRAQAAGKSIAHLLSPAPRTSVPGYANINRSVTDRTPAGFAAAAARAVAAGYTALKLAPFDGVIAADAAQTPIDARTRDGVDRVFAVRDAVGTDIAVMVDCHWRFDVDRAEALLRDIAPAKPYWVECMISEHPLGFSSIARLTALAHESGIRTAGGETIAGTDQAQAMCAGKLYDVLMPDIKYAGGFAGMLAIAGVCADHDVAFAPHNPTGPIAHLASIHVCAAAPTLLWLEHQWNESPLFDALVGGPVAPLAHGGFAVPVAAGLGAALDRGVAAVHPYQPLAPGANLDERLG